MTDRRSFLKACAGAGVAGTMAEALWQAVEAEGLPPGKPLRSRGSRRLQITREMIIAAEGLAGLRFSDAERYQMIANLEANLAAYENIRLVAIPNWVSPAMHFSPVLPGRRYPGSVRPASSPPRSTPILRRPDSPAGLAFLTVTELSELLQTRQVSSVELTRLYLDRLDRHNPTLNCVVTLTEERALDQAVESDRRTALGRRLGPLDGIPYGIKDMFSVPGYPTTWGAAIYRDRVLPTTATVVERLDAAGAVLLAKLSMGELGQSDVWFGGTTRNPWQPAIGSGGSSAGSAAATAAGLVGFGIGTETVGSIITPATRDGVTGLRPTFGRVSRHGMMSFSWSLDKAGVLARSAEDCAIVLEAIAGPDGRDATVHDIPYAWDPGRRLAGIRVGYFKEAFDAPRAGKARDDASLAALRALGVSPVPVYLPTDLPINSLLIVRVEAAAAYDDIIRSGGLRELVNQGESGWPNFVRSGRFVPAVEYLQAQRIRTMLMEHLEQVFRQVDVFLAPTFGVLTATNLTGHPTIALPNGMTEEGIPSSISLVGNLFAEAELCTVARAWQEATGWHRRYPAGFDE